MQKNERNNIQRTCGRRDRKKLEQKKQVEAVLAQEVTLVTSFFNSKSTGGHKQEQEVGMG